MDTPDADLTCGVCRKLMNDPHILPCGHTFCLRPCLLPHNRAMTVYCIHCHLAFHVADLQPNFTILVQICLLAWHRGQNRMQKPKDEQMWNNKFRRVYKPPLGGKFSDAAGSGISLDSMLEESRHSSSVTLKEVESTNRTLVGCSRFIKSDTMKLEPLKSKKQEGAAANAAKTGHQLIVDGLPPKSKENDIRSLFGRFGTVTRVRVDANMLRASVNSSTAEALQMAMAAAPPRFKGVNLRVTLPDEHKRISPSLKTDAKDEVPTQVAGSKFKLNVDNSSHLRLQSSNVSFTKTNKGESSEK
ncbi:hypothetical protein ECG_08922 [Echinococcus granulosus]|uniref:Zinc finger C3HC4 RING type n=1 Tax=Echinococcus granulosus TaxID=6210 RepID=A0A068WMX1_ECHGR|nr:hypothetical protein ECG_08922 [Echinococcus granulosus]CDS21473.1 Zinc finger C3HC4 RING type [Echinococcus granulosus]